MNENAGTSPEARSAYKPSGPSKPRTFCNVSCGVNPFCTLLKYTNGTYTVTPSLTGYTFTPAGTTTAPIGGGTASGINFTEAATP